jgi:hypothetical protein
MIAAHHRSLGESYQTPLAPLRLLGFIARRKQPQLFLLPLRRLSPRTMQLAPQSQRQVYLALRRCPARWSAAARSRTTSLPKRRPGISLIVISVHLIQKKIAAGRPFARARADRPAASDSRGAAGGGRASTRLIRKTSLHLPHQRIGFLAHALGDYLTLLRREPYSGHVGCSRDEGQCHRNTVRPC